jgi:hypothetical protein
MMKRCAFAAVACLLFASISFAQQSAADGPASKEDIEKYLEATHARDTMKTMMELMTKQMHQMVHEQVKKDPSLPSDFEARMDKTTDDMFRDLPIEELVQAMIPAYQKYLSKSDVDALVAFYTTPTGQKILKEMPLVSAEAMQSASGIVQKMMARAQERVQSEMAQVQKGNDGNSKPQPQSTPN